jgi:hypothetical protein
MYLDSVTLDNFRNHADGNITLSRFTRISGDNGVGKSGISEAVVWCIHGTDINGTSKADDRLMRLGAHSMTVVCKWINDNGVGSTLARMKTTGKSSVVTINGKKPKPGEIDGLFGEIDEFLSMFLPGYFNTLEPKKARAVIAKALPTVVDQQEVLDALASNHRGNLEHLNVAFGVDSVDFLADKTRKDIKEQETYLIRLEGQMDVHNELIKKGMPKAPESLLTEQQALKYAELKKSVESLVHQYVGRDGRIEFLRSSQIGLRKQYLELKSSLVHDGDTNCHHCGQRLPEDKIEQIHADVKASNASIQKQMSLVVSEGHQVVGEINILESLTEVPTVDSGTNSFIEEFEALQRLQRDQEVQYQADLILYHKSVAKMEELNATFQLEQKLLDGDKRLLAAVLAYRHKLVQIQHKKLNHLFKNVDITLVEANADGEVKDVFRVNWQGRPYRTLSKSQKARCDIEVGGVLAKARGETMPVFVDNAEGIQNIFSEDFGGQVIAAYVDAGPLTIEVLDGQEVVSL